MTHSPARRRTYPSNETHHRLPSGVVLLQILSRVLFGAPSNLANHNDTVRLLVIQEDVQAVDEVCAAERVAADADNEGLAEPRLRGLVHGFVGEGTGAGDDADAAAFVNEAGHDADFAETLGGRGSVNWNV